MDSASADAPADVGPKPDTVIIIDVPQADAATDSAPKPDATADSAPKPDTVTDSAPKPDTATDSTPKPDTATDSAPKPDTATDSAPKPDTALSCSYGGKTYAIGEIALVSACTRCVCQASGTLGLCTGACSDGGVNIPDASPSQLCESTGGYFGTRECCSTTPNLPDTCGIGACSCGATGHMVEVCECADGCFVPTRGCVPYIPLP